MTCFRAYVLVSHALVYRAHLIVESSAVITCISTAHFIVKFCVSVCNVNSNRLLCLISQGHRYNLSNSLLSLSLVLVVLQCHNAIVRYVWKNSIVQEVCEGSLFFLLLPVRSFGFVVVFLNLFSLCL